MTDGNQTSVLEFRALWEFIQIHTLVTTDWTLSLDSSSSKLSVHSLFKSSSASSSSPELSSARSREKKRLLPPQELLLFCHLQFSVYFVQFSNRSTERHPVNTEKTPVYFWNTCSSSSAEFFTFIMILVFCNLLNCRSYMSLTVCTYKQLVVHWYDDRSVLLHLIVVIMAELKVGICAVNYRHSWDTHILESNPEYEASEKDFMNRPTGGMHL